MASLRDESAEAFQIGERVIVTMPGLLPDERAVVASSGGADGYTVQLANGQHIGVESGRLRRLR